MSANPPDKTDLQTACAALRKKLLEHKNLSVAVAATVSRMVELQENPDENQVEISECSGSIEFLIKQIKEQSVEMVEMINNFHVPR